MAKRLKIMENENTHFRTRKRAKITEKGGKLKNDN